MLDNTSYLENKTLFVLNLTLLSTGVNLFLTSNKFFLVKILYNKVLFAFLTNSLLYTSTGVTILNLFFLFAFLPSSDQKSLDQLL